VKVSVLNSPENIETIIKLGVRYNVCLSEDDVLTLEVANEAIAGLVAQSCQPAFI